MVPRIICIFTPFHFAILALEDFRIAPKYISKYSMIITYDVHCTQYIVRCTIYDLPYIIDIIGHHDSRRRCPLKDATHTKHLTMNRMPELYNIVS